jgi:hypothetical protein
LDSIIFLKKKWRNEHMWICCISVKEVETLTFPFNLMIIHYKINPVALTSLIQFNFLFSDWCKQILTDSGALLYGRCHMSVLYHSFALSIRCFVFFACHTNKKAVHTIVTFTYNKSNVYILRIFDEMFDFVSFQS